MTQEKADAIFNTGLGQQLDMFYCCSDDKVLIRYEEALKHVNGQLEPGSLPLEDKTITEWYPSDDCFMTKELKDATDYENPWGD